MRGQAEGSREWWGLWQAGKRVPPKAHSCSLALTDSALRECGVYLLMLQERQALGVCENSQFLNPKVEILQII